MKFRSTLSTLSTLSALSMVFLVCSCSLTYGQTRISGSVKNSADNKLAAGINVTVNTKDTGLLLTYALTDDKGAYQLSFKTSSDSVVITVSGMSVKKQTITHPNKSSLLNFNVAYESIVLKELKVKPPKIRRLDDTLNYDVGQFTGKNDRTIGEVLKKMPGIKVAEDGAISYHDKPISKFYIEGQDMLEGRYNIATNNVEAQDVETVQVLENHQPVKALKNKEFSDQGAINLKLKEGAKNVLVANTQLGAGLAPVLWNNELFGMYFGKGKQFMATYKGNNTGDDSATDLQNFYGGDNSLGFPVSLGIQSPSGPGVGRKRYLLNRDNAVSLNNLRTIGKDYKLTANISYLNDRQIKDSYSRLENYLPGDSTLVIEERMKAIEGFHYMDATVKLNANKEYLYFDNSVRFSGDLHRNEYGSVENAQFIEQDRSAPYFKVSNNLSVIRNYKKSTIRINSYNGYGRLDDGLEVRPVLYPALFSDPGTLSGTRQSLRQNLFVSNTNIGFGMQHGRFRQNYVAGANASLLRLNSELQSLTQDGTTGNTADSLSNNLNWDRYDIYLTPEYSYADKKSNLTLKLPLSNISQYSNDQVAGNHKHQARIFFTPSLSARYKLNLLWELYGQAGYAQSIDGAENGYTGYIMQSYRYLVQNIGQLPERSTQSYNMSIKYGHPIKMLFASWSGSYYRSKMNLLYGNEFQGFLAVRRTLDIPNTANGYNFSFSADKGLEGIFQKISLNAGYNNSENTQLNQTEIVAFLNESYSAGASINGKLGEWADFDYGLRYGRSENIIKNDARSFIPISSAAQSAGFNLFPVNGLVINLKYEYSFNSAVTGDGRRMNFADAGVRYNLKKLEFKLEYNNIFNTRRYIAAAYNGIGSYYSSYDLRPTQVLMKVRFKIK
ncbi:TonB-dependent receptor [Pedobacter psychroterrae]|uniref:Outer membrane receptor protein involved in Fe transport n=1 Tax=Pedobacter psychroterrae TaxID=2530453 RepID=A0A4V2MKI0_9SPHI|nr:TonB-dependent receptor [Pedobacter psychroterrae]TCC98296.1 hypothetical protein EZ437_19105 [Pedobacter psychroterrae]